METLMNSPSPHAYTTVTSNGNFARCAEVRKKEGFLLFAKIHFFSPSIYFIFKRGWKYVVPCFYKSIVNSSVFFNLCPPKL